MARIICILAISLCVSVSAWAQVALGFAGEDAASVGIYVSEIATGRVIAQNDPDRVLLPASVMKSVTCAAALAALPHDFHFDTPVYLYGHRDSDDPAVWHGNLVVESCADPTIDSSSFPDHPLITNEIVNGLKKLGITTITGQLTVSENLFQAGCIPEWEIGDVAWDYGAGLYGFNYRDNSYQLWPASGRTVPYDAYLDLNVFKNSAGTELMRGIFSDELDVYGANPENPKWSVSLSMNNPSEFFITEMQQLLADAGIDLQDGDVTDASSAQLVCTHRSPSLVDILRVTMVKSHNMFAEGMLRAQARGGSRGDALDAQAQTLRRLGISTQNTKICDGSGLARADRLSPRFISDLLAKMAKSPYAEAYVGLFPRAGVEGTVKSLLQKTPLKGQLALKSGSMGAVQCFAGYKLDASGRPTHTVVILVNGFYSSRSALRTSIEDFLVKTFK